jgi:hypothetical protein
MEAMMLCQIGPKNLILLGNVGVMSSAEFGNPNSEAVQSLWGWNIIRLSFLERLLQHSKLLQAHSGSSNLCDAK